METTEDPRDRVSMNFAHNNIESLSTGNSCDTKISASATSDIPMLNTPVCGLGVHDIGPRLFSECWTRMLQEAMAAMEDLQCKHISIIHPGDKCLDCFEH